jgi:hypothetical protein
MLSCFVSAARLSTRRVLWWLCKAAIFKRFHVSLRCKGLSVLDCKAELCESSGHIIVVLPERLRRGSPMTSLDLHPRSTPPSGLRHSLVESLHRAFCGPITSAIFDRTGQPLDHKFVLRASLSRSTFVKIFSTCCHIPHAVQLFRIAFAVIETASSFTPI